MTDNNIAADLSGLILPPVVGLHGFTGSGKDTIAPLMAATLDYVRGGLADLMKDISEILNPFIPDGKGGFARLNDMIAEHGWDALKRDAQFKASIDDAETEMRTFQQKLGTEVGRDLFGENFWIESLVNRLGDPDRLVITDVRFPNERAWVIDQGGLLINVVRPGYGAVNNHRSEQPLECHVTLANDGSLADLGPKLRIALLEGVRILDDIRILEGRKPLNRAASAV